MSKPWLSALLIDWTAIVLMLIAANYFWFMIPLAVLIIGTRQHAIAILGHEGAHGGVCKNKRLNDWLTCLFCWWPLAIGMNGYRVFHFKHHLHVGTGDDPEKALYEHVSRDQWTMPITRWKLARMLLADLCGRGAIETVKTISLIPRVGLYDWAGPLIFSIGIALLCWWQPICLLWYAALATSFFAVFRLRALTEHVGSDGTYATVVPRLWERLVYLPHNTWCHAEHHRFPRVPFAELPLIVEARERE